ncbi:MAG: DUF881 domain-containing protein [Bacillota bacterium]
MKKEKLRAYTWICIGSIILGIIISFQIKLVQKKILNGYAPNQRANQLIVKLEKVEDEKEKLQQEVNTLTEELKGLKTSVSKENLLIKNLNDKLDKIKLFAGLTKVKGTGVEIIIDNSKTEYNSNNNIVNDYNLILSLTNELNAGGAEALSINGQRVVNTTEIRTAGNNLMVNKVPLIPPFKIKAIGNSKILSASIDQRFGLASIIRQKGYFIEINEKTEVIINKYDSSIEFDYIQLD